MNRLTHSIIPALALLGLVAGAGAASAQGYYDDDRPPPHHFRHGDGFDGPPPWERWRHHRHHWRDGEFDRGGPRRDGFGRDHGGDRGRFGDDEGRHGGDRDGQDRRRPPGQGPGRDFGPDDRT